MIRVVVAGAAGATTDDALRLTSDLGAQIAPIDVVYLTRLLGDEPERVIDVVAEAHLVLLVIGLSVCPAALWLYGVASSLSIPVVIYGTTPQLPPPWAVATAHSIDDLRAVLGALLPVIDGDDVGAYADAVMRVQTRGGRC